MTLEITMNFSEAPKLIEIFKGRGGTYIFHVKKNILYIGKTRCFQERFEKCYLRGLNTTQSIKGTVLKEILTNKELSITFLSNGKELFEKNDVMFNIETERPSNSIGNPSQTNGAIQRLIGMFVEDSQARWDYGAMKSHLFHYFAGQVPKNRIEEVFLNNDGNLSKYCIAFSNLEVLIPKNLPENVVHIRESDL